MEIFKIKAVGFIYHVYACLIEDGQFVSKEIVYTNKSIAECYAWIKARQENLFF